MKNRNRKLGKTAGFTLVEMLIVVAIIAVLIAVSIPLVSNALEQTRDNTDLANERAAKAAASMVYLGVVKVDGYTPGAAGPLYYDAAAGKLVTADGLENIDPYGKCSKAHDDGTSFGSSGADTGDHTANGRGVIIVTISAKGEITMEWGAFFISSDQVTQWGKDNPDSQFPKWYAGLTGSDGVSGNTHQDIFMAIGYLDKVTEEAPTEGYFKAFAKAYDDYLKDLKTASGSIKEPETDVYKKSVEFVEKWQPVLQKALDEANQAQPGYDKDKNKAPTGHSGINQHELWEALGGIEADMPKDKGWK